MTETNTKTSPAAAPVEQALSKTSLAELVRGVG
jgi:hypothetical protein